MTLQKWKNIGAIATISIALAVGIPPIYEWFNRDPKPIAVVNKWGVGEIPPRNRNEHGYQAKIFLFGCEIENKGNKALHVLEIRCILKFSDREESLKPIPKISDLMEMRDSMMFGKEVNNLQGDTTIEPDKVVHGDLAFISVNSADDIYQAIIKNKATLEFSIATVDGKTYPCVVTLRYPIAKILDYEILHDGSKKEGDTTSEIIRDGYSKPETLRYTIKWPDSPKTKK
jgi:hypothetical protein